VKIAPSFGLLTFGAILTFAVTGHIHGFNLTVAGVILMLAGGTAVAHNLATARTRRRTDIITEPGRTTYLEPNDLDDSRS
jgi:hypothetical protein